MNIHLRPEPEEMIEQDVQRGRYQAVRSPAVFAKT